MAVRGAYEALRHRCTVFLYEDLHYASTARARDAGLERAGQVFAGMRLAPIVETLQPQDVKRKMQRIGLYASQHPRTPRSADFTPASALATGPHEIVWRVSPSNGVQA